MNKKQTLPPKPPKMPPPGEAKEGSDLSSTQCSTPTVATSDGEATGRKEWTEGLGFQGFTGLGFRVWALSLGSVDPNPYKYSRSPKRALLASAHFAPVQGGADKGPL